MFLSLITYEQCKTPVLFLLVLPYTWQHFLRSRSKFDLLPFHDSTRCLDIYHVNFCKHRNDPPNIFLGQFSRQVRSPLLPPWFIELACSLNRLETDYYPTDGRPMLCCALFCYRCSGNCGKYTAIFGNHPHALIPTAAPFENPETTSTFLEVGRRNDSFAIGSIARDLDPILQRTLARLPRGSKCGWRGSSFGKRK